jgi:hypothetical protein
MAPDSGFGPLVRLSPVTLIRRGRRATVHWVLPEGLTPERARDLEKLLTSLCRRYAGKGTRWMVGPACGRLEGLGIPEAQLAAAEIASLLQQSR